MNGAALWAAQSVEPGGVFEGRNFLTLAEVEETALRDPNRRVSSNVEARFLARGLRASGWDLVGQVGARNSRVSLWVSPLMASLADVKNIPKNTLNNLYEDERKNHQRAMLNILP